MASARRSSNLVGFQNVLERVRSQLPKGFVFASLSSVYGGLAAAPLFQEIARYAIQRLAIPAAPPVALPPHAQGTS